MNTHPLLICFSPSYDRFSLHAVRAAAICPSVLRAGEVGEDGLVMVLLHGPAELLQARHAHLLAACHREGSLRLAGRGPGRHGRGLALYFETKLHTTICKIRQWEYSVFVFLGLSWICLSRVFYFTGFSSNSTPRKLWRGTWECAVLYMRKPQEQEGIRPQLRRPTHTIRGKIQKTEEQNGINKWGRTSGI